MSVSAPSPVELNAIPLKQGIETLKMACGNHAQLNRKKGKYRKLIEDHEYAYSCHDVKPLKDSCVGYLCTQNGTPGE